VSTITAINKFALSVALVAIEVLALAVSGFGAGSAPGGKALVARGDFDAPAQFVPPKILERRFWNMLPPLAPNSRAGKAMAKHVAPEPMVREAGACYQFRDLRAAGDDPLAVGVDALLKLNPDPVRPFVVCSSAGRPPFRCLDDFHADKAAYAPWRQAHPNFLGFWTGVEWDNEYLWAFGDMDKALDHARKAGCSEVALDRLRALAKRAKAGRDAALEGLHECYLGLRRYYFDDPDRMIFLRGGWCFDQYALAWGGGMAIAETTNTGLYRHQVSLFSVRGAARQYGRPWQWYMATYYNGHDKDGKLLVNCEPNYTAPVRLMSQGAGENAGPGFGMSVSLKRRDMYLAYLSGASLVEHEDWPRAYCQPKAEGVGDWGLSPHGEAMKEWYDFTRRHPERGISYAPVAFLVPFNQGMPQWGGLPWSNFHGERPDSMIDAFLYTVAPFNQDTRHGQEGCLANGEFGDGYDLLSPDPPGGPVALAALRNYKVAILLGKVTMEGPLAERLQKYVRQGGTLVVNARQLGSEVPVEFLGAKPTSKTAEVAGPVTAPGDATIALAEPYDYEQVELRGADVLWRDSKGGALATLHRFGLGNVILTTVDYMLPRANASRWGKRVDMPMVQLLMRQIVREVLPFEVRGDIEFGLCKVSGGWWVYLINNRGVTKWPTTPEELDPAATATVVVRLRNLKPTGVRELRQDKPLNLDRKTNSVTVEVGPGDIAVVKIATASGSGR
jgi:hypothetical protein